MGGRRMGAVGGVIPRFEPLLEDHNETGRSRLIRLSRRRLGGPSAHIMLCAGVEWRLSPYLECNSLRRLKMLLLDVAAARRLKNLTLYPTSTLSLSITKTPRKSFTNTTVQ